MPLMVSEPVISTDPVNCCTSASSLPNIFEPLLYITLEVTVCTTRVWAVTVLVTRRFDAVAF